MNYFAILVDNFAFLLYSLYLSHTIQPLYLVRVVIISCFKFKKKTSSRQRKENFKPNINKCIIIIDMNDEWRTNAHSLLNKLIFFNDHRKSIKYKDISLQFRNNTKMMDTIYI